MLFFLIGFFSLFAQTAIIREYIISFGGNELGLGLFYGFWLIGIAFGAMVSRWFSWSQKQILILACLYPIAAAAQLFLIINLRPLAGISAGEFFSFEQIVFWLLSINALVSFLTGGIFVAGAKVFCDKNSNLPAVSVGQAYAYEAFGGMTAGICATGLNLIGFAPFLNLLFAAVLFLFGVIALNYKRFFIVVICVLELSLCVFGFIAAERICGYNASIRLRGITAAPVSKWFYTPYQNIILARGERQIVTLSDGRVIGQFPENIDASAVAGLIQAQGNNPKRVLIIGQGAENCIDILAKSFNTSIVWCFQDIKYRDEVSCNFFFPPDSVDIIVGQPRELLRHIDEKFDAIIIWPQDSNDLKSNVLFTRDFFQVAADRLKPAGMFACRITTAADYLNRYQIRYAASLRQALSAVFKKVIITPQETCWMFAGGKQSAVTVDGAELFRRFKQFAPLDFQFQGEILLDMYNPKRVDFFNRAIDKIKENVSNTDNRPTAVLSRLMILAGYDRGIVFKIFDAVSSIGFLFFIIPIFLLVVFRKLLIHCERLETAARFNVKLLTVILGFSGLALFLLLLLIFQSRLGTVFSQIGWLNGLFMFGLWLGSVSGKKINRPNVLPSRIFIGQIVLCLLTAAVNACSLSGISLFIVISGLVLAAGSLTGLGYPVAADIFGRLGVTAGESAAILENIDHCAAAFAALAAGVIMIPVLGVTGTLAILICMAIAGLILFAVPDQAVITRRGTSFFSIIAAVVLFFVVCLWGLKQTHQFSWERINDQQDCIEQTQPFKATVCETSAGKQYTVQSKDYAADINGYAGPINIEIGFNPNYEITAITILEHNETTQYVTALPKFIRQFLGRNLDEGFSLKNIDAITGATITSAAVIDTVNKVANRLHKHYFPPQSRRKPIFAIIIFAGAAMFGTFLYLLAPHSLSRKMHLTVVVLICGFGFNFIFSGGHLGYLFSGNFSAISINFLAILTAILLLGVVFGQMWCGWLCPFGAIQELLHWQKQRRNIPLNMDIRARKIKYVILVLFCAVLFINFGKPVFTQEPLSMFFAGHFRLGLDKILSLAVLTAGVFFLRFWCRYFCLCGAFLSVFNRVALAKKYFPKKYNACPMNISMVDGDCMHCNLCLQKPVQNKGKTGVLSESIFKIAVITVGAITILFLFFGISESRSYKKTSAALVSAIDVNRIKALFKQGVLSDKEAMWSSQAQ